MALAAGEGVFRNEKQRPMTGIYVETLVVAASNKPRMALRFPVHQLTILCIHIQCQCVCVCKNIAISIYIYSIYTLCSVV